ncbi:MAG: hypothetical protein IH991_12755 [Planctomycetes bacterium]|nr:hypothetical protein [Planctomycetota bacterium]
MPWNEDAVNQMGTILLTGVFTTLSLVTIWSSISRRHWFLRAAFLLAIAGLMLPARAYAPAALFLVFAFVVFCATAAVRSLSGQLRKKREATIDVEHGNRLQFGLKDFLLAIIVTSVFISIVVTSQRQELPELRPTEVFNSEEYAIVPALTVMALAAMWLVLGSKLLILRIVVFLGAIAAFAWFGEVQAFVEFASDGFETDVDDWVFAELIAYVCLTITVAGLMVTWLLCYAIAQSRCRRFKNVGRIGFVVCTVLSLVPTLFLYWEMIRPLNIEPRRHPSPNGYVELERLGASIKPANLPNQAAVEKHVTAHVAVLKEAENALQLDSEVPLTFSYKDLEWTNSGQRLRTLARLFGHQFETALHANKTAEAVRSFINCRLLAARTARGGMHTDWMIGSAFEPMCAFRSLRDLLSAAECRELISDLLEIESLWESFDEYAARDRLWIRTAFGWIGDFSHTAERLAEVLMHESSSEFIKFAFMRNAGRRQLLITELAIRAHRLEQGQLPAKLEDLVPEYLPAVPQDPFAQRPLVYRVVKNDFLLYSVGPNKKDDGGINTAGPEWLRNGDVFLDRGLEETQDE